jgi:ABC-type iron transport system FetAB ATPase subunit
VFSYLDQSRGEGDTCTAGHNAIARAAEVSPRQVPICIDRLISEGLIERVGYDFGNPDRSHRGSIYRVLIAPGHLNNSEEAQEIKRAIQDILRHQKFLASRVEQLSLAQGRLISLVSQAVTLPGLRNLDELFGEER